MRIISGFRDYYDCVQSQGQDQTVHYLRTIKEVKYIGCFPFPVCFTGYTRSMIYVTQYIVGFCGKIYPVLRLVDEKLVSDREAICHYLP